MTDTTMLLSELVAVVRKDLDEFLAHPTHERFAAEWDARCGYSISTGDGGRCTAGFQPG